MLCTGFPKGPSSGHISCRRRGECRDWHRHQYGRAWDTNKHPQGDATIVTESAHVGSSIVVVGRSTAVEPKYPQWDESKDCDRHRYGEASESAHVHRSTVAERTYDGVSSIDEWWSPKKARIGQWWSDWLSQADKDATAQSCRFDSCEDPGLLNNTKLVPDLYHKDYIDDFRFGKLKKPDP